MANLPSSDPSILAAALGQSQQPIGMNPMNDVPPDVNPMIGGGSKYPHPQHLEDASTQWAQGKMTGKELMGKIRSEGWTIDSHALQRKGSWIEVFDPNGFYHELQP